MAQARSHARSHACSQSQVQLKLIKTEVGAITEADVNLAETLGATIIGFNVDAKGKTASLAEERSVPVLVR